MNYRHSYHAGNYADVMKHTVLVQLIRALQKKSKGFLYLDTHAGRGCYDLAAAAQGESLARTPEWPMGIGRLWTAEASEGPLAEYLSIVRQFDRDRGNRDDGPRFYPGSPAIARSLVRPQDRLALCEKHPEEFAALSAEFAFSPRTSLHEMDGYVGLRAMLPPDERRTLVLIDPPFEAQDEFAQIVVGLNEGLRRLPAGVFAIWYPLTERARVDRFFDELVAEIVAPTLAIELAFTGAMAATKMRGCGVVVVNPPWTFDQSAEQLLLTLAPLLAESRNIDWRVSWIIPER